MAALPVIPAVTGVASSDLSGIRHVNTPLLQVCHLRGLLYTGTQQGREATEHTEQVGELGIPSCSTAATAAAAAAAAAAQAPVPAEPAPAASSRSRGKGITGRRWDQAGSEWAMAISTGLPRRQRQLKPQERSQQPTPKRGTLMLKINEIRAGATATTTATSSETTETVAAAKASTKATSKPRCVRAHLNGKRYVRQYMEVTF